MQPFSKTTLCLASFLSFFSCTAWEYDIANCDPHARDLTKDVCNRLNPDDTACMLYQCDGQTSTCVLSARDFDRDGDAAIECGGHDCNDYDPNIYGNGPNAMCTCTQALVNHSCSVGLSGSACQRDATYICSSNVLDCPTSPGIPEMMYQSAPFQNGTYQSWDWNCDGSIEMACGWKNGTSIVQDCPSVACSGTAAMQISNNDATGLCNNYCASVNSQTACTAASSNPYIYNCQTTSCGGPIGVCYCSWNPNFFGQCVNATCCTAASSSTIGNIYCK